MTTGAGNASREGGGASITLKPGLVFAVLAIAGIVLAVVLKESPGGGAQGENYWDNAGALWSIAAIVAAVLTLTPALRTLVNLDEKRAWAIGTGGAGFLLLWWVLFVLPVIGIASRFNNLPFLATVAIVAAVLAAWTSPGNPYRAAKGSA